MNTEQKGSKVDWKPKIETSRVKKEEKKKNGEKSFFR